MRRQTKDYVLFMLLIKYVSDKDGHSADFAPAVTIPNGAIFTDIVGLKGKSDVGDRINTQIIQPLIDANDRLARTDFREARVDRLSDLIGIFRKPELDFSQNRAEHDTLGDAHDYLMRHFATESSKCKEHFCFVGSVPRQGALASSHLAVLRAERKARPARLV